MMKPSALLGSLLLLAPLRHPTNPEHPWTEPGEHPGKAAEQGGGWKGPFCLGTPPAPLPITSTLQTQQVTTEGRSVNTKGAESGKHTGFTKRHWQCISRILA